MNDRNSGRRGRHCSGRVWALALLTVPAAWAQGSRSPETPKSAAPAAAQPAPDFKAYLRNSKDLLSDTQWESLLAMQSPDAEDAETEGGGEVIEVEGEKPASEVPGGIASVFWALRHPLQSWRILAPIPP